MLIAPWETCRVQGRMVKYALAEITPKSGAHLCDRQVSYLSCGNLLVVLMQLVLSIVSSPVFLLISQLQEPLYVLSVVPTSIGGEEVSKEALHEKSDTADTRACLLNHFHCY